MAVSVGLCLILQPGPANLVAAAAGAAILIGLSRVAQLHPSLLALLPPVAGFAVSALVVAAAGLRCGGLGCGGAVLTYGACTCPRRPGRQMAPRSWFPFTNPVVRSRLRVPSAGRQGRDLRRPVRRVGIEPTTRWLRVT